MMRLEDLPNIGPHLARDLRTAGIPDAETFQALGAVTAWEKIGQVDEGHHCVNSLLALEGAIRGIRWMSLPPEVRAEIGAYARAHGARQ